MDCTSNTGAVFVKSFLVGVFRVKKEMDITGINL